MLEKVVRFAITLAVWGAGVILPAIGADEPFATVMIEPHAVYLVPQEYAEAHKVELLSSIPGERLKVDGFWTPTEQDVRVAERLFRELLHQAEKDPTVIFPDLDPKGEASSQESVEYHQNELALVNKNYDRYVRQYVGIVLDGRKIVFCNYTDAAKGDPTKEVLFLEKFFATDGTTHFLQSRVDPDWKTCVNVSVIGSWQGKGN